jgi:predicted ferric reductase
VKTQLWWYVARSSGIVAWALLSASVLWGLAVSLRLFRRTPSPAWFLDLHRFLGGLSVVFTGAHIAGLVADTYVHFGPAQLLVPFASRWKPGAVAWGVVALYLLVAIETSSLAMKHLPRTAWRFVHRGSFLLFAMATIHGLSAGTDTHKPIGWWVAIAVGGLVLLLWLVRVLSPRGAARATGRHPLPSAARSGRA